MQHPLDFIAGLKNIHGRQQFNILREYLQVMTLNVLYGLKGSESIRFGGGTCLRICHNLPRYSEDLDFSLDKERLDLSVLIKGLEKGIKNYGVRFELGIPESVDQKRVGKYWLKFTDLLYPLGHSPHKSEKLDIKLEIDKHPPRGGKGEFFYVTKFGQYFPIFKNNLATLFSGKIGAVCQRSYHAMRDFYDLLWYLNQRVEPNYEELQAMGIQVKNRNGLISLLEEKTKNISSAELVKKIGDELENPDEKKVLNNYPLAFKQARKRYLG